MMTTMRTKDKVAAIAVAAMFTTVALPGAISPRAAYADGIGRDVASAIASAHGGYTVKGKELSADVVRAVVAVERCEMSSGVAACDGPLKDEHDAEATLVRRGRAVLDAAEPAASVLSATDAVYASIAVAVVPGAQGDTTGVYTPVSVAESPLAHGQVGDVVTPLSRLQTYAGRSHLLGRVHDDVPVTAYNCDPTWCYGHGAVVYSPNGAGWHLNFDFDLKVPTDPPGQVWGSNWRVTGGAVANQSWSNFAYSNSANGDHTEEWPIAYGTINFSLAGGTTQHTVEIHCDLTGDSATWYGVTN